MLIQSALGASAERSVVRAAVAAVNAVCERARALGGPERFWWETAVSVGPAEIAADMGILASEAEAGMAMLRDAGVLRPDGEGEGSVRVDPDVLCDQPLLAAVNWSGVRARIGSEGRLGPALATLREVARLGSARGPEALVATNLAELVDATLYGRSAVSQALQDLERLSLLEKGGQPTQRGLRLRVSRVALGQVPEPGRRQADPSGAGAALPTPGPAAGFVLQLGGATLDVPSGAQVTVERDPTGRPVVQLRFPHADG